MALKEATCLHVKSLEEHIMISGIPVFTMRRFLPKLGALGGNADAKLWDDLEELDFHAFWGVAKRPWAINT